VWRFASTIVENQLKRGIMQLGKWDVEVNGQDYAVSVERAENGKDVVRINGRVATKPIGPEEKDRSINVGGRPYLLRRQGADKYDLQADQAAAAFKSPLALAREVQERDDALNALGTIAESKAPIAMEKDPFFKRLPAFGWLAIVAAVVVMLYLATGPGYEKIALERVNRLLSEMHSEKTSQFAVTFWFKNKKTLDSTEMSIASDHFDKWRQQKDLYRQVGDYNVIDSKVVDGEKVPTAIVRFMLEGKEYRVRVPKDLPISWEE
jgi:hypothetical protein